MQNKWPLVIVLLLLTLSVYSFFYLFESYEEVKDLGWDKKALRNPYLAAEQFLQKTGIKVTSSNNFDQLKSLPESGMVFIGNSGAILTRKRVDEIVKWMEQGGHLIVTAPIYDEDKEDFLLSRFEVKNEVLEWDDEEEQDEKSKQAPLLSEQLEKMNKNIQQEKGRVEEKKKEIIPDAEITSLNFTDYDAQVQVHFSIDSGLTHPVFYEDDDKRSDANKPVYWTGSEYATHFMQFDVGYGLLTVISDNSIWKSDDIDKLDHAYLLWLLSNKNSEVVLLYGANMPSIFSYIWKYGYEMVLLLLVWLVAWLAYRSRRLGPVRQPALVEHRSMAEHIHASAEYLWREKQFAQMIEPLRQEVRHRLQLHFPNFIYLNAPQQMQLIQQQSQLPVERIETAFNSDISGEESQFVRIVYDLQKIRNTL